MKYNRFIILMLFSLSITRLYPQSTPYSDQLNRQTSGVIVEKQNKKKNEKSQTTKNSIHLNIDSPEINKAIGDSIVDNDTTVTSIADSFNVAYGDQDIEGSITYSANDSIIYHLNSGMMYLYGEAHITYTNIKLDAAYIQYNWNNNLLLARGVMDSATGEIHGKPKFTQDGKVYEARVMEYNFKTKRGKVYNVVTEEGGGFIHGEEIIKNEYDEWYGKEAKFTTCELEDPHFYIRANRVKVIPDKLFVTGPANLVVADVPTPLVLPFGIFPVKQERRSGIIFPGYGEATGPGQGFFLRNGGYYQVFSEHIAAAMTGDIFSRGNWGLHFRMDYRKRYKVNGNLSLDYARTRPSDPDIPGLKPTNNVQIRWSYNQDHKAKPLSNIRASINASSSDYLKNSLNTTQESLNTTFSSNVNYEKRFRNKLLTLSLSGNHTQNLATNIITISAPILSFNVQRFNPFRSKVGGTKRKWYEQIGIRYRFETKATVRTIDSLLINENVLDKLQYGARHVANTSANFSLFKYLNITPSFDYTERWYFKSIEKTWDPDTVQIMDPDGTIDTIYGRLITDTINRFRPARDFSTLLSFSTSFFGIFQFKKGRKIRGIKHDVRPAISINYRPDFGDPKYGYYETVQKDRFGNTETYSVFSQVNNVLSYGIPGSRASSTINLSLGNRIQMKLAPKDDSVNIERKIGILDQLNFSMGYDLLAPDQRFSTLTISAVNRSFKNLSLTVNTVLDPYTRNDTITRLSEFVWRDKKRLFRFVKSNISIGLNFASKRSAKNVETTRSDPEDVDYIQQNLYQYYDFNQPWSFRLNYSITLEKGNNFVADTLLVRTHSLSGALNFNLTPKWKIDVQSGYDLLNNRVTLTNVNVIRDLHCWELGFSWNISSRDRQSYFIQLRVKSSVLQELKLTKRSNAVESGSFF